MLREMLDTYWETVADLDAGREIAGARTWRASKIGNCLRAQYLEFVERRPFSPVDARTQRVFAVGHLTADMVGEAFRAIGILLHEELPISDNELDVGAHLDYVVGGPIQAAERIEGMSETAWRRAVTARERLRQRFGLIVPVIGVELKSKSSRGFSYAQGNGGVVAGENNLLQAACYDVLAARKGLQIDHWSVLTVSKDDLRMAEDLVRPEHREQVLERLALLNWAKENRDPSKLECDCLTRWNRKGWKYCPYGVNRLECC